MLRRTWAARHLAPILLAVLLRATTWAFVPDTRFASDEDSYFQVATALLSTGHQDLFWPPVTGWLIAAVRWLLHTDAISTVRLVWIGIDLGCVCAVVALARRVAPAIVGAGAVADRFAAFAGVGYAAYLPAISHAQFATSETPALLQTLLVLWLVSRPEARWTAWAGAGLLSGTLALTRPSLLPLIVFVPVAGILPRPKPHAILKAALFVAAGAAVVGVVVVRNARVAGEPTISTNSSYNLYIGNRDMYGEDLDLFHPVATPEQVEYRRQMWSGELAYPTAPPAELQRQALRWIREHPGTFARRALGRLARVVAPKTDVLELAGGERGAGVFAPVSLALLAVANAQWAFVLGGGSIGLVLILKRHPMMGRLFLATVAGVLMLCLVAISKPRYSFVFDPLLIVGAVATFSASPRAAWEGIGPPARRALWLVGAFVLWGWAAWLIFAVSSRMAL